MLGPVGPCDAGYCKRRSARAEGGLAVEGESGRINAHYGRPGLGDLILDGLRAAGKDPDRLSPEDLAPVDQFHIRGKEATLELAGLAGLRAGQQVLDVGGGLGGPARTIAAEMGCQVTVLDLTEEYCQVGAMLTARTGLQDRVRFQHGSALEMPFADSSFDAVWTQHSSMNIAAKERLYAEIHRVLRPGGRLAMHEIMAGPVQPIHFPVPWAPEAAISFLQAPEEIRSLLKRTGLAEIAWVEVSGPSLEWFRERVAPLSAAGTAALPPLGLHLLLGPIFGPAFQNQVRNLAEQRIAVLEAVLERA
jgi:ubiquinone/menaquinone biosynthesis C-methylase UbiE